MERQIQLQALSQQEGAAAHKLFNEYVEAIGFGKKSELLSLERESTKRRLVEPDIKRIAHSYQDETLIDIAFAEQAMRSNGNPYFALRENEIARDKLKIAERLAPASTVNKTLDTMLHASFDESTHLPEFQIYYPGGFPIDTAHYRNYHQVEPAPRMHD